MAMLLKLATVKQGGKSFPETDGSDDLVDPAKQTF